MKKAVALVALFALLAVCVIPMADSADATDATTVSAYFYNEGKDISTATNITIKVIYYDGVDDGKVVGETDTVTAKDPVSGNNKFTVTITPEADLSKDKYYFFFNIDGFSVKNTPHTVSSDPIEINVLEGTTTAKKNCYQITETGSLTVGEENVIATNEVFTMKSAVGIVKGTVTMSTAEPTYLNGVKVTLFDIDTKKELTSAYTSYHGSYEIEYNTGTYGISFEINGYDTFSSTVTIGEGTTSTSDASLKQNTSYFGLDLSHVLMILGGAAAIILLLFATFMRLRISKR